jgi:PAS domain S-box-containing protein
MANKPDKGIISTPFREKAEKILKSRKSDSESLLSIDKDRLIYELEVHQIELEMQNEELRNAQLVIEDSRHKYSNLYDFSPTGYLTLTKKGLILDTNRTFANFVALKKINIINKYFSKFVYTEDQDLFYLLVKKVERLRTKQSCELRIKLFDQIMKWSWVKVDCTLYKDLISKEEQLLVTVVDINDIKDAEDKIVQAKTDWQNTFDAMSDWVCLVDLECKIIRSNKVGEDYSGQPVQKILGQACCKTLHGTEQQVPGCPLDKMVKTKKSETVEMNEFNGNRWFQIKVDPLTNDKGDLIGAVHIVKDITESKKTEYLLRKSEERFRILFDQAPLSYQSLDEKGCFVDVNHTFLQTLGYSRDEILGKWFGHILAPESVPIFKKNFPRFKNIGVVENVEFSMLKKDGSTIIVSLNGKIGYDLQGNFKQTHCIFKDITLQKETEKDIIESEKFNRSVTETVPNLIYIYDSQLQKNSWMNSNYENYLKNHFGLAREEFTLEKLNYLVHPEDLPIFYENSKELKEKKDGHVPSFEFRMKSYQGWRWLLHQSSVLKRTEHGELSQIIGSMIDITERKRIEEALKVSEESLKTIIDSSPFPIAVVDVNTKTILHWSKSAKQLFGHDPKTSQEWHELAYPDPDYRDEVIKRWKPLLEIAVKSSKAVNGGEYRIVSKDGSTKICELYAQVIHENLIITTNDITERRQAEEERRKAERQLRTIVENHPDLLARFDEQCRCIYINPEVVKELGIPFEHFIGKSIIDLNLPGPAGQNEVGHAAVKQVFEQGCPNILEAAWPTPNGDRVFEVRHIPELDERGNVVSVIGITRDITERKLAEDALRDSEARYKSLFENAGEGIVIVQEGILKLVNPKIQEITGYSKDEILNQPFQDFIYSDDQEMVLSRYKQRLMGEALIESYPIRIVEKNGNVKWVEINAANIEWELKPALLSFLTDITERKEMEEELEKTKQHLQNTIDGLAESVVLLKEGGEIVLVNQVWREFAENNGVDPVIVSEGANYFAACKTESGEWIEDIEPFTDGLSKVLSAEIKSFTFEYPCHSPEKQRWFIGTITLYSSKDARYIVIAHENITKRKQAEKTLLESEERYRNLIENAGQPIFQVNEKGEFIYMNRSAAQSVGIEQKSTFGKSMWDIFPKEIADRQMNNIRHVFETGNNMSKETSTILQGKKFWHDTRLWPIRDISGKIVCVQAISFDVTDRKQAEETLRENQEKLDLIFNTTTDFMALISIEKNDTYRISSFNNAYWHAVHSQNRSITREKLMGMEVQEFAKSLNWSDVVLKETFNKYNQIKKTGQIINQVESIPTKDRRLYLDSTYLPIFDTEKKCTHILFSAHDITDKKLAEIKLQESEEKFRTLTSLAPVGIYLTDPDGNCQYVNEAWCEMTGLTIDQALGAGWKKGLHIDDRENIFKSWNQVIKSGGIWNMEYCFLDANNKTHWVYGFAAPILDTAGEISHYIGVNVDFTKRKQVEEELNSSKDQMRNLASHLQFLRERERADISREIHDKLGQSLTALKMDMSWLAKQKKVDGTELRLKTKSMITLIDETITTVKRISTELRPGLLDDLGLEAAIEWQVSDFQERAKIRCEVELGTGDLEINQEISTALFRILQESLTNVARHAKAKKVKVALKYINSKLILEISDDGVGITQSQISDMGSIGLMGMQERLYPLKGTFNITGSSGKGTTVKAIVPVSSDQ